MRSQVPISAGGKRPIPAPPTPLVKYSPVRKTQQSYVPRHIGDET